MSVSDVLAGVAIVISLLYSYRLSRRTHDISIYYGVIGMFRELDKTFVEYPEIRPYFYEGKSLEADDPNLHRVRAVAELVLDAFEWIWHRKEELNTDDETGWMNYIADTYFSSPALQQHYASVASWYPGITRLIAEREATMRDGTVDARDTTTVGRSGRRRFHGVVRGLPWRKGKESGGHPTEPYRPGRPGPSSRRA